MSFKSEIMEGHYYQGGYDFDFVQDVPKRFECPICLLCQRNPQQTSCGHRFCYSCINTWLNEGRTCPGDNCKLSEGNVFPDSMANREILQLMIKCPYEAKGCASIFRLADVDHHLATCQAAATQTNKEKALNTESKRCPFCHSSLEIDGFESCKGRLICPDAPVACPYLSAGCSSEIKRRELSKHIKTEVETHLNLLWETIQKLRQTMSTVSNDGSISKDIGSPTSLPGSELNRDSELRLSGSNLHANSRLLKDLFSRVVSLEQSNYSLRITNEALSQKLRDQENANASLGRFCHGKFIWNISNFPDHHSRMRERYNQIVYSPGFYSSPFGYRVCLRMNINLIKGEEYLGVFVHLMSGENDEFLSWPFRGTFKLTIIRDGIGDDFKETLTSPANPGPAFEKPKAQRNLTGFGFTEFIRVNGLYSGQFVRQNLDVVMKAEIIPYDEGES